MKGIYFEDGENYHIKNQDIVKLIRYNDGRKIKVKNSLKHKNILENYQKLNADEYVHKPTGEIFKYKKGKFKSKNSINRSMNKLKELLTNNFDGGNNESFITLTYEQREENFENAVSDLKKFWVDLKKEYQDLEYVGVIENQQLRCSWHIHMLIKDTKHNVYDYQCFEQLVYESDLVKGERNLTPFSYCTIEKMYEDLLSKSNIGYNHSKPLCDSIQQAATNRTLFTGAIGEPLVESKNVKRSDIFGG